MPYSQAQHNAFEARAHGAHLDSPSLNAIPPGKAAQMAAEGVKKGSRKKSVSAKDAGDAMARHHHKE